MSVKEQANKAKYKASKAASDVKAGAERAASGARTRAVEAYDRSREAARSGARRTGDGIDRNPFVALAGGLALGAILGALIPRSRRERDLMRDVGKDLNVRAHSAFDAAKAAGQSKLEERGLTTDAAETLVRDVARGVQSAAKESASAATEAARTK